MESLVCIKKRLNGTLAVDGSAIPQQDDRPTKVSQEVLYKPFDIPVSEVMRTKLHVEPNVPVLRRNAEGANGGDPVLLEPVIKMRRLPFGCPCTSHIGDEQKAALIEENQMGAKFCGFFLCEAIRCASNEGWLFRSFVLHGVLVFDNSIPVVQEVAKRDWDDTEYETVSK